MHDKYWPMWSFTRKNTALLIYCVFWERFSCWSLIHTLDYKNIMSMAFPMSGNILLDTLIIIILAILAEIEGFYFFIFCWKKASQNINFWKTPKGASLAPFRDSDSTWSHDIKSTKNHCGTFNAWLPQTSTRLMETIERNGLYDQIIIISGKKMKYLFNLLSSHCAAWRLAYSTKNSNELVQNWVN